MHHQVNYAVVSVSEEPLMLPPSNFHPAGYQTWRPSKLDALQGGKAVPGTVLADPAHPPWWVGA